MAEAPELIVGIDLGTTNSLVAICENGKPRVLHDEDGVTIVPSIIHWSDTDSHPIVGKSARKLRITDARNTAYSVKRFMGRGKNDLDQKVLSAVDTSLSTDQNIVIRLGNRSFSAIELSAEILKKLKHLAEKSLNQKIVKAVITVPAYFNDSQRTATKLAGQLAGLEVVRIVNEPTAAALAYGLDRKENSLIAVYDLGGGTFDVSILRIHHGIFEVLATGGDTTLGGDDFDLALVQLIVEKVLRDGAELRHYEENLDLKALLIEKAEKIKVALTLETEVAETLEINNKKFHFKVSRQEFETAISLLVQKTIKIAQECLKDAGLEKNKIDHIVLVGGSTRVPLVRKTLRDYFGKELDTSVNPDEVVALGAAVQADILAGRNDKMVLLDVVPLSLGIETYGGTISKIIHRNTKIPSVAQETFTTHVDGQRNVLIHVLQGERELATDCRSLAKFDLRDLPPMPAGLPKVQVTFLVDANGILTVRAKELATKTESTIEVKPSFGLDDAQVEKMLQDSFDFAEKDMKSRQLIDTRGEAEGVLRSAAKILENAKTFSSDAEIKAMGDQMKTISALIPGSDYIAIKDALEKLEEIAKPVAAKVMNSALQKSLGQKSVDEVLRK